MRRLFIAFILFAIGCKHKDKLFISLSPSKTGIEFNNQITENDSINPIDMEFLYNGGGVAIGDFNNDSLPDIYFTASQVSNKLYLNKGNLSFKDVTDEAQVTGEKRWCNAASVIDINNDGWQDIYVCATIKKNPLLRKNLFYINQGLQKDGVPLFKEMANEYHLADTGLSVHAAFLDYDNDGDIDMYLVNTKLAERSGARFDGNSTQNKEILSDKLFRNDGVVNGIPVFTDVSAPAGIKDEGYGLGITVADVNQDGWQDIYVTNDFYSNDVLYINKKNGTFSNKTFTSFKHTSRNAMGNDIADFNNDGLPDIIAVDMDPENNYRKKTNMDNNNYYTYQSMTQGHLMLQYVRNTLQLNNGTIRDTSGLTVPVFSDIGYYAGVAETDWSWSSLFADFDNDGYKDLFITNGYPKDVTDHDFINFYSKSYNLMNKADLSARIPQIKISNYAYRNEGASMKFENMSKEWGLEQLSFSAGAAFADLDNDGDLDYIVNNTNDKAFIYENRSEKVIKNNFLNIKFRGGDLNKEGIGASVELFYAGGKIQTAANSPYRGYLSTMYPTVHFGLGKETAIDSMRIKWPGGKEQMLLHPPINQVITVDIKQAVFTPDINYLASTDFTDVTDSVGVHLPHVEADFIDFDIHRLMPHKLSEYGPGLAVGDVDGNGLDDIFEGASLGFDPTFLLQQADGRFIQKKLTVDSKDARKPEILGALLFDADGDGDLDLYAASGSNESAPESKDYQDRFFVNDGKGNFTYDESALPMNVSSKNCVKATDFDNDGDLDIFVGSRFIPLKYPLPANSFIFRNDSQNGKVRFTEATQQVAPELQSIGLVCDAIWSDYDNDGWTDLILAGEWMPITFLKNEKGILKKISTGFQDKTGWWTSITGGDFDNDGDIDYIAGNLGENSFFKADSIHPVRVYSGDFAKNGKDVLVPTLYLPDNKGVKKEFTAHNHDDVLSQMPAMKKRFLSYQSFAEADIDVLFNKEDLKKFFHLSANYFTSTYIENKGNGNFAFHALPALAQQSPLNGMVIEDINEDGFLDLMIVGNDYGTEVSSGRFDACNGLELLGNGDGTFRAAPLKQSGFFVPGNAKALVKLKGPGNSYLLAASQNRSWLRIFRKTQGDSKIISLNNGDKAIYYTLTNGKTRKEEVYFGNSYLSQSSRFICTDKNIKGISVVNQKNDKRSVQ